MHIDITLWTICGAVLLLAGLVKGVIGLGLPTISIGTPQLKFREVAITSLRQDW